MMNPRSSAHSCGSCFLGSCLRSFGLFMFSSKLMFCCAAMCVLLLCCKDMNFLINLFYFFGLRVKVCGEICSACNHSKKC